MMVPIVSEHGSSFAFQYPGAVYHVMARGDGGKRIFETEEDHAVFVARWGRGMHEPRRAGARLGAKNARTPSFSAKPTDDKCSTRSAAPVTRRESLNRAMAASGKSSARNATRSYDVSGWWMSAVFASQTVAAFTDD